MQTFKTKTWKTKNYHHRSTCRLSFKSGDCNKGKKRERDLPSAAGSHQQMANVVFPAPAGVHHLTVESTVLTVLVLVSVLVLVIENPLSDGVYRSRK